MSASLVIEEKQSKSGLWEGHLVPATEENDWQCCAIGCRKEE